MTRLKESVDAIASFVGDARKGLPDEVFRLVTSLTPMLNVDLLIKNEEQHTLLTWREDEFYQGWHVPGGIVRYKERMVDRVAAVARIELGARVRINGGPVAINEVMHPTREVRGHFISILYACDLAGPLDEARRQGPGSPKHGDWAWHATCPPQILRQHEMYRHLIEQKLQDA